MHSLVNGKRDQAGRVLSHAWQSALQSTWVAADVAIKQQKL